MGTFPNGSTRNYIICNGCPIIKAPVDIDTVDGRSYPGVAPAGVTDSATGEAIAEGAPVTVFFGPDGEIVGYKDCTDDNTFGVIQTAAQEFTDTAGGTVKAGGQFLLLPNGGTACLEKTIDTVDGYADLGVSDGSQVDQDGVTIAAGAEVINFFDAEGAYTYSKDCTDDDTFGVPAVASEAGDAINGPYVAGQTIVTFPGEIVVCIPAKTVDTDTQDGYSAIGESDGSTQVDADGAAIPAGAKTIDFYGPTGEYVNSCPVVNTNTQDGFVSIGVSDGSQLGPDGLAIAAGVKIISEFNAAGQYVVSCPVVDNDTQDGYSAPGIADGVVEADSEGNIIAAGIKTIDFYNADGVYLNSCPIVDTDTWSDPMLADSAGIDFTGKAYEIGDPIVVYATGEIRCLKTLPVVTPNGNALPQNSAGSQIVTQCCTWTQEVDADGNVTPPSGVVSPAVDPLGNPVPPGTLVTSTTDVNGIYASSIKIAEDFVVDSYCEDGSFVQEFCSGKKVCTKQGFDVQRGRYVPGNHFITNLVVDELIGGASATITIDAGKQGIKGGELKNYYSVSGTDEVDAVNLKPRYRIDGGAWVKFQTGGVDQTGFQTETSSGFGEIPYVAWEHLDLSPGTHTIEVGLFTNSINTIDIGDTPEGYIRLNTADFYFMAPCPMCLVIPAA